MRSSSIGWASRLASEAPVACFLDLYHFSFSFRTGDANCAGLIMPNTDAVAMQNARNL